MKKLCSLIFVLILGLNFSFSQRLVPDHLNKMQMVTNVTISPSGNYVAYLNITQKDIKDGVGYANRHLYVYDTKKKTQRLMNTGSAPISSLSWLPSEDKVTFRQRAENNKGIQVFSLDVRSEKIEPLTSFDQSVGQYEFRNKEEIVFTSLSNPIAEKQVLLDRKIDLKVFQEELQHLELYRYNIKTQKTVQILANKTVYDFAISPDGSKVVAAVTDQNYIDDEYMFKKIHIIDLENGRIIKKLDNQGKLGKMAWSPDGKQIAFVAASGLHDAVCGSLFIMNVENQNEKYENLINIVKGLELSVKDVIWENNTTLLFTSEESVDITLSRYDISKKSISHVIKPALVAFSEVSYFDNQVYFAGNTWQYPNELMHFDLKKSHLTKVSSHNDSWLKDVKLARQEKITYKARDGKAIEGVLVYPLNYQEGKTYPMIVYIHGGPESAVQNAWLNHYSTWGQFAAARDYFVFSPNYRASSGRGVDFTMAGYGELLGAEYDDVLDGIDYLIASGKVDKSKVGIGGGSYGGYFAAYSATKHSERFAASVVFVGISNQVSKRNTTDIPLEDYLVHWGFWNHENMEKVWEASPVKFANGSKTATLILHGEEDTRIPTSQGKELYTALKLHGDAPVRLVLYPGEGHGNAKNINRYDFLVRTLDWFDFYLIKNPGSKELPGKYINYE